MASIVGIISVITSISNVVSALQIPMLDSIVNSVVSFKETGLNPAFKEIDKLGSVTVFSVPFVVTVIVASSYEQVTGVATTLKDGFSMTEKKLLQKYLCKSFPLRNNAENNLLLVVLNM